MAFYVRVWEWRVHPPVAGIMRAAGRLALLERELVAIHVLRGLIGGWLGRDPFAADLRLPALLLMATRNLLGPLGVSLGAGLSERLLLSSWPPTGMLAEPWPYPPQESI